MTVNRSITGLMPYAGSQIGAQKGQEVSLLCEAYQGHTHK